MNYRGNHVRQLKILLHYMHVCFLVPCLFIAACKQEPSHSLERPLFADSIMGTADSILNSMQVNNAVRYIDSVYGKFPDAGPVDLWKNYNFKLNFYIYYQFDTLKARVYADSMLMMVEGKEDLYKVEYANTLFAFGKLLVAERKYEEAFYYYYNGQVYASKNLDSCALAPFNSQLGMVRYKQGKYLAAIPYLREALDELRHCSEDASFFDRFIQPQSILNTIALCYEKAELLDSSIFYYREALSFINEKADLYKHDTAFGSIARGVVMGNLGGLYAKQGKYNEAVRYLSESIAINNRIGYAISDAQTAVYKLADLYIRFREFPAAGRLLDQLENYLLNFEGKNSDYDDIRLKWYRVKWMYYDSTHMVPQAYDYARKYYSLKDSVALINQGLSNVDMDESFRNAAEKLKLELLKRRAVKNNLFAGTGHRTINGGEHPLHFMAHLKPHT